MTTTTDSDLVEVMHALRVKGLASDAVLAAMTALEPTTLSDVVDTIVDAGWANRREGRMAGTMLTPAGRARYDELRAERSLDDAQSRTVAELYAAFLPINTDFKQICAAWQMRDDTTPNDHTDAEYDSAVIADLAAGHDRVNAILTTAAEGMPRWSRYQVRLDSALAKVRGGDKAAFARPMYDSYHDIWMELHQDLLLTAGRERGTDDE
ncbi:MarR family winged helix-turn-helix transcriptional regulator [Aldersonia sp. NBC_00410]|uniref:MarR family winged helix-turn-helix transcriptional regulator n=1 Tax=Aldersonia sp. NBC_00410 TaxID=2975954 RepID=UPI00225B7E60|nr:MarR family winged helix-turn-helix transcriptional regulator [Aldersonia sp. NBC_00410]MCX5046364.1 MarR family winged helix-turn-helix transcriptional regulator [Aldersonia sp. NBC_00410]